MGTGMAVQKRLALRALCAGVLAAGLAVSGPAAAVDPHSCEGNFGIWNKGEIDARLETRLRALYQVCAESASDQPRAASACRDFFGEALETGWNLADFKQGDGYAIASTIAARLNNADIDGWDKLGPASSQEALTAAAARAASGHAVVAAFSSGGVGHISLILPGGTARSGAWDRSVPRAISLPLDQAQNAFFGCRLSWGYGGDKIRNLFLYAKAPGLPSEPAAEPDPEPEESDPAAPVAEDEADAAPGGSAPVTLTPADAEPETADQDTSADDEAGAGGIDP